MTKLDDIWCTKCGCETWKLYWTGFRYLIECPNCYYSFYLGEVKD